MPAAAHTPVAPRPRRRVRPRTGGALGRLLAGLVGVAGIAALLGLVAVQNGWLVVKPGTAPVALASTGDVVTPPAVALAPADPDSANAGVVTPAGDSVSLPALDPAYGAGTRDSTGAATAAADSLAGLGDRSATPGSAPVVIATPAELSALRPRMTVPVRGVAASTLRDEFELARGGGARRHEALDIMAPRGTPVVAATDGALVKLFDSKQGGLTIYQADATKRFVLLYGHLDRYETGLQDGAAVKQGQVIGYVGSTGNADPAGPHLHFAVARSADPARWWSNGTPVNPFLLLKP
jgi:murein DD-endopeptidase MepM/ murein hydrolase activator NlpD